MQSEYHIECITTDKLAVEWVKKCGEKHEVLSQTSLHVWRGASLWILLQNEKPVSYNITRIGKRKKNVWEPYANWYVAYTVVSLRRLGLATRLIKHVLSLAKDMGCRRMKALAGTSAGLALHASLGDQFWGLTENLEVVVDTPMVHLPAYLGKTPPNATTTETVPWPLERVVQELNGRNLRYDKERA